MKNRKIIEGTHSLTDDEIEFVVSDERKTASSNSNFLLGTLFFDPSTRTRTSIVKSSIEAGIQCHNFDPKELRLSDGETSSDTAMALGQYCDALGIRYTTTQNRKNFSAHEKFCELAHHAKIPVLNLETDKYHPGQILADFKTLKEHPENLLRKKIVISWAYSPQALRVPAISIELISLLRRFSYDVTLVRPDEFAVEDYINDIPKDNFSKTGDFKVSNNFEDACEDAAVIYARNWTSKNLGKHSEKEELALHQKYKNWTVTRKLLSSKAPNAKIMHCLPVDRDNEIESSLLDDPNHSLIQTQMKNRVHIQKMLIKLLQEQ